MEELFEEIKKEVKEITKQKKYIAGIRQMLIKNQNELKILVNERNKIQNKDSYEYELVYFKIKIEDQQRKIIYREWLDKTKQLEKRVSESKERFLKQIGDQIEEKFDIEHIGELNGEENTQKHGKQMQRDVGQQENIKRMKQLEQEWEKWREYYNKCCKIKKENTKEEIQDFLSKAQEILKRKIERTQEEFYIIRQELNSDRAEEVQIKDERSIEARIADVSMADRIAVNEKAKQKLKENKDLYEEDDRLLSGIITKLDDLYKQYIFDKRETENSTDGSKDDSKKENAGSETKVDEVQSEDSDSKRFRDENKYNMTTDDIENIKNLTEAWKNKLNGAIKSEKQGDNFVESVK